MYPMTSESKPSCAFGPALAADAHWSHPIDFLQEALVYRGFGWSVLPCVRKKGAVGWKPLQKCRPTDKGIGRMFKRARQRVTGVAVVCGRVSGGLAVRDFDTREAYRQWA